MAQNLPLLLSYDDTPLWRTPGPALMAMWSKELPLTCSCLSPLPWFEWVPKIGCSKKCWRPIFQGRPQYTEIITMNKYFLIRIRYDILTQCHGNYIEVGKNNNHILRFDTKTLLSPGGDLWGFECPNDTKMPCWLRLYPAGWSLKVWVSKWHSDALLAKTILGHE